MKRDRHILCVCNHFTENANGFRVPSSLSPVLILPDKRKTTRGQPLSAPIGIVPGRESGYPDGLMLSPPGIVLLRLDSGCPRWGRQLSGRIGRKFDVGKGFTALYQSAVIIPFTIYHAETGVVDELFQTAFKERMLLLLDLYRVDAHTPI